MQKTVLLFIDWFLPGTRSGGPVRSITNMVEHLEGYADFLVVTRDTDYMSEQPYKNIKTNQWNSLSSNVKVYYLGENHDKSKKFKEIIEKADFDIAYINGIYSFNYSILPLLLLRKKDCEIIVGTRGMLNPQAFSVKKPKKKIFLLLAKLTGLYKNVTFHATNLEEQGYIEKELGENYKIKIAPNLPRKMDNSTYFARNKESGHLKLVNIARIAKEKGQINLLRYLKMCNEGKIELEMWGSIYDESYWDECKDLINELPSNVEVAYKGVAESSEVLNILSESHFFIMPSEGENFGHSILEALSQGLPVIISDKTPWKNLEEKGVGWDIAIDNDQEFVKVIKEGVEMSNESYTKLSLNSKKFAENFINDSAILEANKELFA